MGAAAFKSVPKLPPPPEARTLRTEGDPEDRVTLSRLSGPAPEEGEPRDQVTLSPQGEAALGGRRRGPGNDYVSQGRSEFNPHEDTPVNANCGPAVVAMALAWADRWPVGPDGQPMTEDEAIEAVRQESYPGTSRATDETAYTGVGDESLGLLRGARSLGLNATSIPNELGAVDGALERGQVVAVLGVPAAAGVSEFQGQHWILVTGTVERDGQTLYVVNDPYAPEGDYSDNAGLLLTRQQLQTYLDSGDTYQALAMGPPDRTQGPPHRPERPTDSARTGSSFDLPADLDRPVGELLSRDWRPAALTPALIEGRELDLQKLRALDPAELEKTEDLPQVRRELLSRALLDEVMVRTGGQATLRNVLAMTYKNETALYRSLDGGVGLEAFGRHLWQASGLDGNLSESELLEFLGTQQGWYGNLGYDRSTGRTSPRWQALEGAQGTPGHYTRLRDDVGSIFSDSNRDWRSGVDSGNVPYTWGNVVPGDRDYDELLQRIQRGDFGNGSDQVCWAYHVVDPASGLDYIYFVVTENQPWRIGK
ncbi:MAG: hypothetical protein AB1758_05220 [Candidatus Eremiobacterota bacterium]